MADDPAVPVRRILDRWSGKTLWEGPAATVKEAVVAAAAARADLGGADLRSADLRGADLRSADLGGADLRGADLRSADLRSADLGSADLGGADLRSADLGGADLGGADLGGADLRSAKNLADAKDLRLPTGETWSDYLTDVVPALLTAGGKSLDSFAEHWECHDWSNCPIAHAFDAPQLDAVPVLLRPRADQFIQFFDSKQIHWDVIQAAIAARSGATA